MVVYLYLPLFLCLYCLYLNTAVLADLSQLHLGRLPLIDQATTKWRCSNWVSHQLWQSCKLGIFFHVWIAMKQIFRKCHLITNGNIVLLAAGCKTQHTWAYRDNIAFFLFWFVICLTWWKFFFCDNVSYIIRPMQVLKSCLRWVKNVINQFITLYHDVEILNQWIWELFAWIHPAPPLSLTHPPRTCRSLSDRPSGAPYISPHQWHIRKIHEVVTIFNR